VALGVRPAVVLVALVTVVLSTACGGSGDDNGMRLVLTDDGCTYEGEQAPAAGMFTVEVENQTEHSGAFALSTIAEGSTIDDLEPYLDEARQQFEQSGTLPDLPPFYEQLARSGVDAGASSFLPADVPAGRYALMCFVDDLPTWRIYAAAQLDVE
jgi:hypothetical protein